MTPRIPLYRSWKLHVGRPTTNVLGFTATRETALQFAAYELESWGLHEDGEPCPICRKFDVEPHMREAKQ